MQKCRSQGIPLLVSIIRGSKLLAVSLSHLMDLTVVRARIELLDAQLVVESAKLIVGMEKQHTFSVKKKKKKYNNHASWLALTSNGSVLLILIQRRLLFWFCCYFSFHRL